MKPLLRPSPGTTNQERYTLGPMGLAVTRELLVEDTIDHKFDTLYNQQCRQGRQGSDKKTIMSTQSIGELFDRLYEDTFGYVQLAVLVYA